MTELTEQETRIHEAAIAFARANKKRIAKEATDKAIYKPEADPVSVFMAGSPGAGKTETAKALLLQQAEKNGEKILRIDADELRHYFADYNGKNSVLFQAGASILLDKVHDLALANRQSFILDGTLSNYDRAEHNIRRSLGKGRAVTILYVYQDPQQAWTFVQARERIEGRRILPESFVEQYFAARDVVNKLKFTFDRDVRIELLVKNHDGTSRFYKANIDRIDNHLPEKYDRAAILRITETH